MRKRQSSEDDKVKDLTSNAGFRRGRQGAGREGEVLKRSSHQETLTEWKHGQEEEGQV